MTKYFVFDVESAGLYGLGFAFGYVVVDKTGKEHEAKFATAGIDAVSNNISQKDMSWLKQNIPQDILYPEGDLKLTLEELRIAFKSALKKHKEAIIVSDCGYPVEAKWLLDCQCEVYPLHDLATALLMRGKNPLASYDRTKQELPAHHPLADSRQSARIWIECLSSRD